MNPILRKILAAGGLTRQGKLVEATAAIQRALAPLAAARTPAARAGATAATASVVDSPAAVVELERIAAPSSFDEPAIVAPSSAEATVDDRADRESADAATVVDEAPAVARQGRGRFLPSSFTGAAGTRAFKLFVPDGFAGEALPLVVMLHGCTQDPDDFAAGTRMNVLAQEQGFLVLYPAQAPRSNAHKCWNWFSPRDQRRGAGEPALIAGMTRHILQTHSVDHDRVYVAGLSAGGAMAAILAREYPELFAAAGIHSGIAPGAAHDVASAFSVMKSGSAATSTAATAGAPLIVFHGDADATVVPANGDAVIHAALADLPSLAATTSDGFAAPGTRAFRRTVWRRVGGADEAPSVAEQWIVRGAPHAWSGGAEAGSYTDPAGPDASREMLRFFREHPRRRG